MTGTTDSWRDTVVTQVRLEAEGVVSLTLAAADGRPLPSWEAGAHIDVRLPSGTVRQYSLCGAPDAAAYTVAVLREDNGRGGSAEIHDTAFVGRTLPIRGPRNHFPLRSAEHHVLVAGGIGITPVLALAREASRRGDSWELHYGGRSAASMAFTHEVRGLGGEISLVEGRPLDLASIVSRAPSGAAVYACGPAGLLTALRELCTDTGTTLYTEQFTADPKARTAPGTAPDVSGAAEGESFEVELARTGATVTVEPGTSILDAVRTVCPDVLSSCEEGFCGTCETKVLAGKPIHADSILNEREREVSASMMICVGGCASRRLVLDL
ncbi:PDR/VanB family oxidoreductase [Streptomyces sp. NPDC044780]|uniref:PDR/VanB family oxidoreductase n=1 Tax=Streptomyces luomodiensis TaxID=3026192 RepID=A0ABY9UP44_9ACTN|nr:PDR/VanB family oxidoreductase [Streptomyces sp. SCA4-21]WNE94273.1 PDR/VanB family oxidoreductase [Streptomyces sp. SCA4-21]